MTQGPNVEGVADHRVCTCRYAAGSGGGRKGSAGHGSVKKPPPVPPSVTAGLSSAQPADFSLLVLHRRVAPVSATESVERLIPADAAAIFAVLADPSRHRELDGSGTVRAPKGGGEPLTLGSRFQMGMRLGLPYTMVNTVVEFEPDRRIAWQAYPPAPVSRLLGGRIWRYELEPAEGGTLVRETWDISQERVKALVAPARRVTRLTMTRSLERLERLMQSTAAAPSGPPAQPPR